MAAAVAPLAPATAVADTPTPQAPRSHARPHEPPPPSDIAVDRQAGRIATMRSAAMAAAVLVGFLLLGTRGRRRHRARLRPVKPALPIAVPPRPD
jgi:hypothetical protein